ncbi:VOC family protein [Hydrogenophaga sp. NFH-34]|uniref:VOC family protein n=1 Tax=Hydrogenophaga sp. NFH-34 TaxID=2744446 RepID=UPI001F449351|nr:VOC family protein [Hydrogenophaga sp. NFH-34]
MTAAAPAQLDHLVVAARTLDDGVAWCRATLGVEPGPGGAHPLFGTHNRLLRLDSVDHPRAYLEIIAIDPPVRPQRAPSLKRWFDLDDPALQARLAQQGPQLVHWVAAVPDLAAATAAWAALGIDRGPALAASRPTPDGLLQWQITVRDDGQRLFDGALPTLIQWGDTHPSARMAGAGLTLRSLHLQHPQADRLQQALAAIGLTGVAASAGPARLTTRLSGPDGQERCLTHPLLAAGNPSFP